MSVIMVEISEDTSINLLQVCSWKIATANEGYEIEFTMTSGDYPTSKSFASEEEALGWLKKIVTTFKPDVRWLLLKKNV